MQKWDIARTYGLLCSKERAPSIEPELMPGDAIGNPVNATTGHLQQDKRT
jgi:hypothetical protein